MMPRRIARLALLLTLATSLSARADLCQQILTKSNLTRAQVEALWTAGRASVEVNWRAFTKVVRGKFRTVVLLGDRLDSLPEDVAAARPVFDHFDRIGTVSGSTSHEPTPSYATEFLVGVLMMPSLLVRKALTKRGLCSPMHSAKESARCRFVKNMEAKHRPSWVEEANLLGLALLDFSSWVAAVPLVYQGVNLLRGVRETANVHQFLWAGGIFVALRAIIFAAEQFKDHWPIVTSRNATIAEHLDDETGGTGRTAYLGVLPRGRLTTLERMLAARGFEELDLTPPAAR